MTSIATAASGSDLPPPNGNPVALVVEDEALIEWMLVDVLEEEGFLAICAHNIAEARSIMESRPEIELFLIDSGLPDGDGLDLIPEIQDRYPSARIAAATGRADVRIEGITLFIKPYEIEEIAAFAGGRALTSSGRGPAS